MTCNYFVCLNQNSNREIPAISVTKEDSWIRKNVFVELFKADIYFR